MKTLKEKCEQFVLEQFLTEIPEGKTFEEIVESIRNGGDYYKHLCDTCSHFDPHCVAMTIENQVLLISNFCQSLLSEKEATAGNPLAGIKKCIDDIRSICDELDGAVKEEHLKVGDTVKVLSLDVNDLFVPGTVGTIISIVEDDGISKLFEVRSGVRSWYYLKEDLEKLPNNQQKEEK